MRTSHMLLCIALAAVGLNVTSCGGDKSTCTGFTDEQNEVIKSICSEFKEEKVDTVMTLELNAATYPSVGDYNISIYQDNRGITWLQELRVQSVVNTQHYISSADTCAWHSYDSITMVEKRVRYDLSQTSVELRLVNDRGNFRLGTVKHGKAFDFGSEASITFNGNSNATIIPNFQFTQSPVLIGGQDTREFTYGNKGTDYFYCDLEYKSVLTKRVRVWYQNGELHISANRYTRAVKLQLNTCGIDFRHWGDTLNVNHLGKFECSGCPKSR